MCVLQKVKEQSKKTKSEKKIKVCVQLSCAHIWSLKVVAMYGH